jgi:hypothetical protein
MNFKRRIKMRVCFILGHWLEKYLVIEDQNLWTKLEHFIHNTIRQDPIVRQEAVVGLLQSLFGVKVLLSFVLYPPVCSVC